MDTKFLIGFTYRGCLCCFALFDGSTGKEIVGVPIAKSFNQRDVVVVEKDHSTSHDCLTHCGSGSDVPDTSSPMCHTNNTTISRGGTVMACRPTAKLSCRCA